MMENNSQGENNYPPPSSRSENREAIRISAMKTSQMTKR